MCSASSPISVDSGGACACIVYLLCNYVLVVPLEKKFCLAVSFLWRARTAHFSPLHSFSAALSSRVLSALSVLGNYKFVLSVQTTLRYQDGSGTEGLNPVF